ncbi:hypothetical protein BZA05DRAFT_433407 [Tricharina praecox]|uniref:uncharacterized protein n=1 Tax=Tricharina praecox TaxID=43433 RepID=UPI00222073A3|nr:uncharacterized protein BZA05DRAFT_433407 [Tricharina praecox]KAI5858025.1 hypothetical protein BZA05DRAFT_433407 [Tricharina praecox]
MVNIMYDVRRVHYFFPGAGYIPLLPCAVNYTYVRWRTENVKWELDEMAEKEGGPESGAGMRNGAAIQYITFESSPPAARALIFRKSGPPMVQPPWIRIPQHDKYCKEPDTGVRSMAEDSDEGLVDFETVKLEPIENNGGGSAPTSLSSWRTGMISCILCMSVGFLLNLIITIWAVAKFSIHDGLGTVYEGSCAEVKTLSCLMSPTREEVDRAHAKGEWLDIGVPSVRNLWSVKRRRMMLWWFLAFTSVPLHLLFDVPDELLVYAPEYETYVDDARRGWLEFLGQAQNWKAVPARECFSAYDTAFVSRNRNVAVVLYGNSSEALLDGYMVDASAPTSREWLSRPFSTLILAIVVGCNAVKAICMTLTLLDPNFILLVTNGDAIRSFLLKPDPNTAGICYADKQYIVAQRKAGIPWNSGDSRPQPWKRHSYHYHWRNAVSLRRLMAVGILLWRAVQEDRFNYTSNTIKDIWNRGFDQTILSFLYLLYNALFTSMLSALEWNSYANSRKPLRVTNPRSGQRSSYYLQLPYRFALTLMLLSGILHWITSQAIFLARIEIYPVDLLKLQAVEAGHSTLSVACFSTVAIIVSLPVGSLTVVAVILMGLRKYRYHMPIPSGCSAAISAACHLLDADEIMREEIVSSPLQWGDVDFGSVNREGRIGHLTFSAHPVGEPVEGKEYAGSWARREALR